MSLIGLFAALGAANAAPVAYTLDLRSNFGSGFISVGTGQVIYDMSLVQSSGTFVAPGGLGLLSLEINIFGFDLTLANAVNGPNMPTLYLKFGTLAPQSLWGAWGNTGTNGGPGFLFSGQRFDYNPSVYSLYAYRSSDGSSTEGEAGGSDAGALAGLITYTAVPEASTWMLFCAGAFPLLAKRWNPFTQDTRRF